MPKFLHSLLWIAVALLGALAVATIAIHRREPINAMWTGGPPRPPFRVRYSH